MKKIFIILLLTIATLSYSQEEKYVMVSNELTKLVQEYIMEAAKRGIDVVPIIVEMDYIILNNELNFPFLGLASKDGCKVLISSFCGLEPIILKVTLFHELTHSIFKIGHTEKEGLNIMNPSSPESFRIFENEALWQAQLDIMFKEAIGK